MWLAREYHAFGFHELATKSSQASVDSGGPGESADGNASQNAECGALRIPGQLIHFPASIAGHSPMDVWESD